jgi:NTE family protein
MGPDTYSQSKEGRGLPWLASSAWNLDSVLLVSRAYLPALLLCAVVCASLPQQSLAAEVNMNERQRIGLVLGGGGAKGAAHIGVLTVLEELRVPVDCITGTSMGALVGGTYAAGMPADDLEVAARAINWSETLGKQGLRDRTPINQKLASRTYTNSLELGIKDGRITVPGGLLKTQDIEDTIRDLVNDARLQKDFDDLPIPFRAVATDMVKGEMVVLDSGDLSIAMRASMSIPGAFSPVIIGDKVLTDGGMMRNLPVDIARSLCADVVIAVWLSTPPPKAEELDNALALVGRSLGVMIDANEKAQIATLTEHDIGIDVPMGDIGTGDFQRVPDAIELGKVAAEKMAGELSRLSIPEEDYLAWREHITTADSPNVQIAEVQIKGLQKVSPEYVEAQLENLKPPAEVSSEQISEDTDRIYATGFFKKVDYNLTGPPGNKTIEIFPVEKPWGPNYLRFDFGLYAEGSGDLMAVLRGEHTRAWMNKKGGTWTNTVQLGRPTLLTSSIYQPIDEVQRFFISPTVSYENSLENIYSDGHRVARYELRETYGELAFGANIGTRAQLTTGLRTGQLQTKRDTGILILPEGEMERDTSIYLTATYDTRDDIGLPTKGSLAYLRYLHADSWLGGETRYDLAEGVFTKSFPWRGDSLSLIVGAGGLINGILPPVRDFTLGGIRSFPGLRLDELRGAKYWFAGTSYLWKLADIQPLMGQALYAGLRLQAGEMRDRRDQVDEGTLYGISGSINGRTPIGPFMLSLGYVSNDSWELHFSLGRPLPEGSALDEIQ